MRKIIFVALFLGFSLNASAERVWTEWFKIAEINQTNHGAFYIKSNGVVFDPICWYVRFQKDQLGTDVYGVSRALSLATTALVADRYIKVQYDNSEKNCFSYNITIK